MHTSRRCARSSLLADGPSLPELETREHWWASPSLSVTLLEGHLQFAVLADPIYFHGLWRDIWGPPLGCL